MINRGNACGKDKRFAEALQLRQRAGVEPDQEEALNNRCVALAEMDRFDEALAGRSGAADRAARCRGPCQSRQRLLNLAQMEEALASYNRAVELDPEHADANFNAALTHALPGRLSRRLAAIRISLEEKRVRAQLRDDSQPLWRGETDLHGKTILLHGGARFWRHHPVRALCAAGRGAGGQGATRRAASAGRSRQPFPALQRCSAKTSRYLNSICTVRC